MAGRGPQTFKKRQKEQQRKEKQAEKSARRLERKNEPPPLLDELGNPIEEDEDIEDPNSEDDPYGLDRPNPLLDGLK
ncbi:MAG: hypothetical protein H7Y20_06665 [Bryobacteraceae bacterium]|nr:hypothetical protein [Bryobacteraceae bacterium]